MNVYNNLIHKWPKMFINWWTDKLLYPHSNKKEKNYRYMHQHGHISKALCTEKCQTQEITYWMIQLICYYKKGKKKRNRDQISGFWWVIRGRDLLKRLMGNYSVILVVVTWLHKLVKIHWAVHVKSRNFTKCKLHLKKNQNQLVYLR